MWVCVKIFRLYFTKRCCISIFEAKHGRALPICHGNTPYWSIFNKNLLIYFYLKETIWFEIPDDIMHVRNSERKCCLCYFLLLQLQIYCRLVNILKDLSVLKYLIYHVFGQHNKLTKISDTFINNSKNGKSVKVRRKK